jgi:hypothetical protein
MTGAPRITLNIGTLSVSGATRAEAHALASALRESLAAHLAADPAALAGIGTDRLSVTVPAAQPGRPAALGQAAGQQIATALSARKGGT